MKNILGAVGMALLWAIFVLVAAFYGWWMKPVVEEGDSDAFFTYARDTLQAENQGNAALLMLVDGHIAHEYYSSNHDAVDAATHFSLASMSKWFTAYGALQLVESGAISLDAPVNSVLSRWQLPASEFDLDGVTLRTLLSHTAGLEDGLGFGDFKANETLPSLEQSLAAPRASGGRDTQIAVTAPPGQSWQYSGGGYLVLELLIEEVSGQRFDEFMQRNVFDPLGMQHSGYEFIGRYENNAGSYTAQGKPAELYQYASKAATALTMSPQDVAIFVSAQLDPAAAATQDSSSTGLGLLNLQSLRAMRAPHAQALGADIWGLGTMLFAPTASGDFVFGHDGGNDPAINTVARVNPDSGDALIVLLTGHPSLATRIGSDWVLWQTGMPDFLASEAVIESMVMPLLLGLLLLFVIAVVRARSAKHAE